MINLSRRSRSENFIRRFKSMMETVAKSAVPTETSLLLGIGDEVWMGLVLAILTILVCYHFLFSESQTGVITGFSPPAFCRVYSSNI